MATDWYYTNNGSKRGPVAATELKALAGAGKLLPTDPVWKNGMAAWRPAGKVQGLFPPPLPAPVAKDPPPLPPQAVKNGPPPLPVAVKKGPAPLPPPPWLRPRAERRGPRRGPTSLVPPALAIKGLSGRQLTGVLVLGGVFIVVIVAVVALIGRGGGRSTYDSVEAMTADFDRVYRAKPNGLAFDLDDLIVTTRNNKAAVYIKLKGESQYKLLTAESQKEILKKRVEKGGVLRLTGSEYSQSFDDGVVMIKWSYGYEDTANLGVKSIAKDFKPIGLKLCDVIK
jgi:hypothetical protein